MRKIKVGRFNKRILFEKKEKCINEIGETYFDWKSFKIVWAKIEVLNGKEYIEAKKIMPELVYKITIRYNKDINYNLRINYNNKILKIDDVINIEEANTYLQIMATERVDKDYRYRN